MAEQEQQEQQQQLEQEQQNQKEKTDSKTDSKTDLRQLLRPAQETQKKEDEKPKDLRHLLCRTVSGTNLANGPPPKQEEEKPKDLCLLLRRTQSGVSLTNERDAERRADVRPQLRGSAGGAAEIDEDTRGQFRAPALSPRSPGGGKVAKAEVPSKDTLRLSSQESDQKEPKKSFERTLSRRNTSGSDVEDEEKKNPRLQFRRTVSASSLKIPNKERKRLIHCAGKKRVHIRETDPVATSLNNHDVYEGERFGKTIISI